MFTEVLHKQTRCRKIAYEVDINRETYVVRAVLLIAFTGPRVCPPTAEVGHWLRTKSSVADG